MNVLSLFDGMSCGQIALYNLGIKVDNYYSCEIDKHAISVTMSNFPNTVQLGDVTKVNGSDLPQIDLLIGGSPCQGFSFAGKQLNFNDPRSALFFEYVRLLKETNPKYFLLENVKMKEEFQDVISDYLGVKPILINSSLVSAQNRPRLYWTNIPGVDKPEDKNVRLIDILDNKRDLYEYISEEKTKLHSYKRNYLQYDVSGKGYNSQGQRAYYLSGKHGCMDTGGSGKILENDGKIRKITRNEGERLQTVPDDYTRVVSKTQALKMLGNGWTVDVIQHIFSNIR